MRRSEGGLSRTETASTGDAHTYVRVLGLRLHSARNANFFREHVVVSSNLNSPFASESTVVSGWYVSVMCHKYKNISP